MISHDDQAEAGQAEVINIEQSKKNWQDELGSFCGFLAQKHLLQGDIIAEMELPGDYLF
jgi:hypothetical protein